MEVVNATGEKINQSRRVTVISLDNNDAPDVIKHSLDDALKLTRKAYGI